MFALKPALYRDQPIRTGVIIEVTKATHWPVLVQYVDGSRGYLNFGDFVVIA